MDLKHLTQWLRSAQGLVAALLALFAGGTAIWAAVSGVARSLAVAVGLPPEAALPIALMALGLVAWILARSFLRFARASRVERPEAFTLRPTTPESLIGRESDLQRLSECVRQYRLVLLDGESGCGKSALVSAGLIPTLKANSSLLPVLIREWGDDWERGPIVAALGALYEALEPSEREAIGWQKAPDLAADTSRLVKQLAQRLRAVAEVLGRRPLLVADQFDDYQALHHGRFFDLDGNWLQADSLEKANTFWKLVASMLGEAGLHVLIVTRSDTAAGSVCVRLIGASQTATRSLSRVDIDYLRPLLNAVAPDSAVPPIVSNPSRGWHELKDRLEMSLRREGAVLMQQVRTVLLGTRSLPVLTPRAFTAAGGIRGIEALFISRALQRAALTGRGADELALARSVLSKMVIPGSREQIPKARRASWSELCLGPEHSDSVRRIVQSLQRDEIVRPAEQSDRSEAWQLDHDYLAKAVIAEARQADRWNEHVKDGYRRYQEAGEGWFARWKTLLPTNVQFRLWWEALRHRASWSTASSYVRLSLLRPAFQGVVLICLSLATLYFWHDQRIAARAERIEQQLGLSNDVSAVVALWGEEPAVRARVYQRITQSESSLERVGRSLWWRAHLEFDPVSAKQSAFVIRSLLEKESDEGVAGSLAEAYAAVVSGRDDASLLKNESVALRGKLEKETNKDILGSLTRAYVAVVGELSDATELQAGAAALRGRIEKESDGNMVNSLSEAYAAVASKLGDSAELKAGAATLGTRLTTRSEKYFDRTLIDAYAVVTSKLSDADQLMAAAATLRARIEMETNEYALSPLGEVYLAVLNKINNANEFKAAAIEFRGRLEKETDDDQISELAELYAGLVNKFGEADELKTAAITLRVKLNKAELGEPGSLGKAYVEVVSKLSDVALLEAEAIALRGSLKKETDEDTIDSLGEMYLAATNKSQNASELKAMATTLRGRLKIETEYGVIFSLGYVYTEVLSKLGDAGESKAGAATLRRRLEEETDRSVIRGSTRVYMDVLGGLSDAGELKAGVAALRGRLVRKIDDDPTLELAQAYAALVNKLGDANEMKTAAAVLRSRFEGESDRRDAEWLASGYVSVVNRLGDANQQKAEAATLRSKLRMASEGNNVELLCEMYMAVVSKLSDADELKAGAEILLAKLEKETDEGGAGSLGKTYAAVVSQLGDANEMKAASAALRRNLEKEEREDDGDELTEAYEMLLSKISDVGHLEAEAVALRRSLETTAGKDNADLIARAYVAALGRLGDSDVFRGESIALRGRVDYEADNDVVSSLAKMYAATVSRLGDRDELKAGAIALRGRLEQESDPGKVSSLCEMYMAVVGKLGDEGELKAGAAAFRRRLERESTTTIVDSLAEAYAAIVKKQLSSAAPPAAMETVIAVLTQARHPTLDSPEVLLEALQPVSHTDFGDDWFAAVRWARDQLKIDTTMLRPGSEGKVAQ